MTILLQTALAAAVGTTCTHMARADDTPIARHLSVSGFVDAYFAYDLTDPTSRRRPDFLFNHARNNEFNINLAMVRLAFDHPDVRAVVNLMAGTYAEENLAHEQALLRNIYEAWAGARVAGDLWLEAGIFESEIGAESAISSLNLALTRSLAADNSPYYFAGARLRWRITPEVELGLGVVNGWQNIRETADNGNKGLVTRLHLTPSEGLTLNWSTLITDEAPRGVRGLRLFNNLFAEWRGQSLSAVLNFDVGAEQRALGRGWNAWYTFYLVGRFHVISALSLALRVERFADPGGVLIAPAGGGAALTGLSAGVDLHLPAEAMLRFEARALFADRDIFRGGSSAHNVALTTSLAVTL